MRSGGAWWLVFIGMAFGIPLFQINHVAFAGESGPVEVTKTVPGYGEEISNPKDVVITIHFNRDMDPTMNEDIVLDQRGVTDLEGNPIQIIGKATWPNPRTLQFRPHEALKPDSTYQISLFSVRTIEGEEMESVPFRLVFTTR
jgi:hypothetical protein